MRCIDDKNFRRSLLRFLLALTLLITIMLVGSNGLAAWMMWLYMFCRSLIEG